MAEQQLRLSGSYGWAAATAEQELQELRTPIRNTECGEHRAQGTPNATSVYIYRRLASYRSASLSFLHDHYQQYSSYSTIIVLIVTPFTLLLDLSYYDLSCCPLATSSYYIFSTSFLKYLFNLFIKVVTKDII